MNIFGDNAIIPPDDKSKKDNDDKEEDPCGNKSNDDDSPCYKEEHQTILQLIYILAIISWLALTTFYGINPPRDGVEALILFLPIIAFTIAFVSVHAITPSLEATMLKANLLTLGLLVALPLINWSKETSTSSKILFVKLAATSIILSMITLIDFWLPKCYLYIEKHIKSIFQTIAIVLLIFGLYRFFAECAHEFVSSGPIPDRIF